MARDWWSRRNMMAIYFFGTGATTVATGFAKMNWELAGLATIGLLAAIYHPAGTAMLVARAARQA
jgi:hypothetical protein